MACFHPINGWRSQFVNPKTGKRPVVFNANEAFLDLPVVVPCGRCIGCRLERSRQWAMRCVHEASLHSTNCFITLTYRDDDLPRSGSLVMKHFQDFMKRLRFHVGSGVRYFHCGEYGDKLSRPHYHACLFNYDFPDKLHYRTKFGVKLYYSQSLEDLWGKGFCTIGDVTFESAAYVARYITKKITGEMSDAHYGDRSPEYVTMSRRPGIATGWFEKYGSDVFPSDEVVMHRKGRAQAMKPPKFYDRLFEIAHPIEFEKIKLIRKSEAKKRLAKYGDSRLDVLEEAQRLKLKQLTREYEI